MSEYGKQLPHLMVEPENLSPYAIVVGDNKRVHQATKLMDDVKKIGNNREYTTITGTYGGNRITVTSHGIGAGGANVCFMELFKGGVHTIIRAGTCGALDPEIDDGEFIIITGAVREDRVTDQLMPIGFPAISDREILSSLINSSRQQGHHKPHIGLAVTYANFYASPILPSPYEKYIGYGVKALEMEMAGLLVLGLMHNARAGGILTSDGNLVRERDTDIAPLEFHPHSDIVRDGVMKMLNIALQAISDLATNDSENIS